MVGSMEHVNIVKGEEPPAYEDNTNLLESPQEQQPQPQQLSPVPSYIYGYSNLVQPQESNQNKTAVMITQPVQVIVPGKVDDNMTIAVISIFYCLFIGIFALMKSLSSREALRRGDIESARALSTSARKLAIVAIACGVVLPIVIIIVRVVTVEAKDSDD